MKLAANCYRLYSTVSDSEKRMLNTIFFEQVIVTRA